MTLRRLAMLTTACGLLLAGCTPVGDDPIRVTGSATVAPVTAHMALKTRTAIEQTSEGTLDGFGRFCRGESQINNASVPIPREQQELCAENDVEFIELPVAVDSLSVVRNSANGTVRDLTMEELRKICPRARRSAPGPTSAPNGRRRRSCSSAVGPARAPSTTSVRR